MSSDNDMREAVDHSCQCGACGEYSLDDNGICGRPTCAAEYALSSMLISRATEEARSPKPENVLQEIYVVHVQGKCGGLIGVGGQYHLHRKDADEQVTLIAETCGPRMAPFVVTYVPKVPA